uniref:Uncharacterized protein n=1 Tax=Anguilla anguilla TaxID=7936 RepID=A0A0E9TUA9_ANGAN
MSICGYGPHAQSSTGGHLSVYQWGACTRTASSLSGKSLDQKTQSTSTPLSLPKSVSVTLLTQV